MRRLVLAAVFASAAALGAAPVRAQSPEPPEEPGYLDPELRGEAERLARESLENLLKAMDLFLKSIPQYEAPQITPEGDIIIRRKPFPPVPERAPDDPDETKT